MFFGFTQTQVLDVDLYLDGQCLPSHQWQLLVPASQGWCTLSWFWSGLYRICSTVLNLWCSAPWIALIRLPASTARLIMLGRTDLIMLHLTETNPFPSRFKTTTASQPFQEANRELSYWVAQFTSLFPRHSWMLITCTQNYGVPLKIFFV